MDKFSGTSQAPRFPATIGWVNPAQPVGIDDLLGRLTLVYFWHPSRLNCQNALKYLRQIRNKHPHIEVVSVYVPYYKAERKDSTARALISQYATGLIAVTDMERNMANLYGAGDRPTLVFIDPKGRIVTRHYGEFDPNGLGNIVQTMLAEYERADLLSELPNLVEQEKGNLKTESTSISFPTEVVFANDQIYVTDSTNGRIVVIDREGSLKLTMVLPREGISAPTATGLAVVGDEIYVTDSSNGYIYRTNSNRNEFAMYASGEQLSYGLRERALPIPISLVPFDSDLYITVAGINQVRKLPLTTVGEEGMRSQLVDAIEGADYKLIQPAGITASRSNLFVVDSAASTVSVVNPRPKGRMIKLVGGSQDQSGDLDAVGDEARLQFPTGIVYSDDILYVADTYNNKIKRVNLRSLKTDTIAGDGGAGHRDGDASQAQFNHPRGLTVCGDMIYIADTNNAAVRGLDLNSGTVQTLVIKS